MDNDLLGRITNDLRSDTVKDDIESLCDARSFVDRAPEQVDEFLKEEVRPELAKRAETLDGGFTGDVRT